MKTQIFLVILMIWAGGLSSCKKDDIDMSKIDFSNIEDLYAQPLPVIQKCVQGKWKWYVTYGGAVGINYPVNTFVDIYDDHYVITNDKDMRTIYFTWKKCFIDGDRYKTWVMWDKELDRGIWFFESIKNDTLGVGHAPTPATIGSSFTRVK